MRVRVETCADEVVIRVLPSAGYCFCSTCGEGNAVITGSGPTFPEAVQDVLTQLAELNESVYAGLAKLGVKVTTESEDTLNTDLSS